LDYREWAIRIAFKREGYICQVKRRKPPLSDKNKQKRLNWAKEHKDWMDKQ
jgi:hypothetical protein